MLEGVIIDNYNDGSNHPYTVNTATFQDMPSLVASIAQNKQHLIVGVKSGVANDGNDVYNSLLASKCYVSSGITQKELVGMQETTVIYPDF
jgi:alpha-glucosidase (family GH31 glycosyl hydrolase)